MKDESKEGKKPVAAKKPAVETVDDYIAGFPQGTQKLLKEMRAIIRETAPGTEERIAYRMPSYWKDGYVVHFAAFAHHIGFYPLPETLEEFADELKAYKSAKGSVQFPLDRSLPAGLIKRMVKFRLAELAKAKSEAGEGPSGGK